MRNSLHAKSFSDLGSKKVLIHRFYPHYILGFREGQSTTSCVFSLDLTEGREVNLERGFSGSAARFRVGSDFSQRYFSQQYF
jgi:hypothetical protein